MGYWDGRGKVGISNPKTRALPNNAYTRPPITGLSGVFWVGTRSTHNFWVAALVPLNFGESELKRNTQYITVGPRPRNLTQMLMHFLGLTFVCRLALHLMTLRIFCKL